jgi:TonB family protein
MRDWNGVSRRRVPRFQLQAPVDVMVLRSGVPDTVPGRSLNLCERGVAAMLAGEVNPGETVGVEVQLSAEAEPLRTKAIVRYQDKLRCGLEFEMISNEQRSAIREWAKATKSDTAIATGSNLSVNRIDIKQERSRQGRGPTGGGGGRGRPPKKRISVAWIILLAIVCFAAGVLWWRWSRDWDQLESGIKGSNAASAEKPHAQVPTEVMQKLLVHKVDPVYPPEARKENIQGIIALNVVIGSDGSVSSMRAINGPDVLAHAAMDALRWWKFEPYRVNGEPVAVETTFAVEFKK